MFIEKGKLILCERIKIKLHCKKYANLLFLNTIKFTIIMVTDNW